MGITWAEGDMGYEGNVAFAASEYYLSFNWILRVNTLLPLATMHVLEQHDRSTFFGSQLVRWDA